MNPLIVTVALPEMHFLCRVGPGDASSAGPDSSVPELQVLNHYAGVWEDEIYGANSLSRSEIGEWVLDGSFLRQSWISEGSDKIPKATGITMMTFDRGKQTYLSWSFLAIGSVVFNEGQWDPQTHTMTWTDRISSAGDLVITTARFSGGVKNDWSIVEQDPKGRYVREVTGTSLRRRA
jgi:hypothetical protein